MAATRFEALARSLLAFPSRRALFSLGLSGLLGVAGIEIIDARKKKKKKCKKKCPVCQRCKKGKCKPKANGTACGENRTCGTGECLCAAEFAPCDGACCGECDPDIGAICAAECPPDSIILSPCDIGECCACDIGKRLCNGACVDGCPSGQRLNNACQCVVG